MTHRRPSLAPRLTDALCTRCGLCCDGTVFGDVELAGPAEATRVEILGLGIEDDDTNGDVLSLPCAALRGSRCSIYALRPACCRDFECRLLQNARRGTVTVGEATARIATARRQVRRVRALLALLETADQGRMPLRERCTDALAGARAATAGATRTRASLQAAMSRLEHTVQSTFLGPERRRR
jgi:Fe-S-cluster containining protein